MVETCHVEIFVEFKAEFSKCVCGDNLKESEMPEACGRVCAVSPEFDLPGLQCISGLCSHKVSMSSIH